MTIDYTDKYTYRQTTKAVGKQTEERVKRFLSDTYKADVRRSSKHEDIYEDIDLWMGTTPISVKRQDAALRSGNFGFEIQNLHRKTKVWEPSWYINGKAEYYVIVVGETLYQVSKARLVDYVDEYGWDRVSGLSDKIKALQATHIHEDSECGLIRISKLIAANVARVLT